MNIGISTACLYPMVTEDALDQLLEKGFRLFEIFFNTFSELDEKYVQELSQKLTRAHAHTISLHPFTSAFEAMLFFSDYPRRTQDGLELYRKYFETANRIGAHILVLHGQRNYQKSRISPEQYLESYHRLYCLGQEYGVTVAQENVVLFRSEKASFIQWMHDTLKDECAFVLDIKQAVRAGEDPMEMCKAMGNRLVHLHLNDHLPQSDCLLPGKGNFDFVKLFDWLKTQGYQGDGVIEVYRDNYHALSELCDSHRFLLENQHWK